ncbi:MAG: hypothetical protein J7513_06240 [Solirubrobacteraceae bacterium]|nr:hypothetical protein [Solirubrobacteraceae bacterium]
MGEALATRHPVVRGVVHALTIALLAVAIRLVYGPGFLGVDAMWSLAWGHDLAAGSALAPSLTTTPHVLSNLLGLALVPFGQDADRALVTIEFLGAATLVWCVAATARAIAGIPAGVLAGLVMATQEQLLFATRSGYLDVFAAVFVAAAGLVAVRGGERRWLAAGVMLALAGLLRPEPWLLLAVLAAWRWRKDGAISPGLVALVVVVPVLWAVTDLVLSGDALYSLHQTRAASERFRELQGIDEGIAARLASIPKSELRAAGPVGVVLGGLAALLAFWPGAAGAALRARWLGAGEDTVAALAPVRLLVGAAAVLLLTVAAEAVTGTLLFARFSLPAAALLIAAGVSTAALVVRARVPESRASLTFAVAGVGLLVIAAPLLAKARRATNPEQARNADARALLRPGVPCLPLSVPTAELRPHAAVWAGVRAGDVVDALDVGIAPAGSYADSTTKEGQLLARGGWTTVKVPDLAGLSVPVVREARGWILRAGTREPVANAKCG